MDIDANSIVHNSLNLKWLKFNIVISKNVMYSKNIVIVAINAEEVKTDIK